MQKILLGLIKAYRYILSPYVGQHCRFLPTCSCYAEEALRTHGTLKGSYLAIKRLLRCHPFAQAGVDPVPPPDPAPKNPQ